MARWRPGGRRAIRACEGIVGDPVPHEALSRGVGPDALRRGDRLARCRGQSSKWIRSDLPHAIARYTGVLVLHVVAHDPGRTSSLARPGPREGAARAADRACLGRAPQLISARRTCRNRCTGQCEPDTGGTPTAMVRLPARLTRATQAFEEARTGETSFVQQTVLIVDDHAGFRHAARALLEADGFRVVGESATGGEGLAAAELLRPDLVLLDVGLPDIDGIEVTRRLRWDAVPAGRADLLPRRLGLPAALRPLRRAGVHPQGRVVGLRAGCRLRVKLAVMACWSRSPPPLPSRVHDD